MIDYGVQKYFLINRILYSDFTMAVFEFKTSSGIFIMKAIDDIYPIVLGIPLLHINDK